MAAKAAASSSSEQVEDPTPHQTHAQRRQSYAHQNQRLEVAEDEGGAGEQEDLRGDEHQHDERQYDEEYDEHERRAEGEVDDAETHARALREAAKTREDKLESDRFMLSNLNAAFGAWRGALDEAGSINQVPSFPSNSTYIWVLD